MMFHMPVTQSLPPAHIEADERAAGAADSGRSPDHGVAEGVFSWPPADPGTETRLSSDSSGVAQHCDEVFGDFAKGGWRIVHRVVSLSPQYGVVWRADFVTSDDPHHLSRMICWRANGSDTSDGYQLMVQPLEMLDKRDDLRPLAPDPSR